MVTSFVARGLSDIYALADGLVGKQPGIADTLTRGSGPTVALESAIASTQIHCNLGRWATV